MMKHFTGLLRALIYVGGMLALAACSSTSNAPNGSTPTASASSSGTVPTRAQSDQIALEHWRNHERAKYIARRQYEQVRDFSRKKHY